MSILQDALDTLNSQCRAYRKMRAASPELFGHSSDGFMDGTPDNGPMGLTLMFERDGTWQHRVIWGVHKHPFPLSFIYCIGTACDSRGERTDQALILDIRDMPRKFIGRYKIDRDAGCGRRSHCTILQRALAAGFDLDAHCLSMLGNYAAEEKKREAELERMLAEGVPDETPF